MKMSLRCCSGVILMAGLLAGCTSTGPAQWQSSNDWYRKDLDGRYPPGRSRIEVLASPGGEHQIELMEPFQGDEDGFMRWAVERIEKDTNQRVKRCDVFAVTRGGKQFVDFVFYTPSPSAVLRAYTRSADEK